MSKCEVIAIANQKGGVGKTTTTFTLGVALKNLGKKVLLIDADPQGDLTTSMGWHNVDDINNSLATIMDSVMNDKQVNVDNTILHHEEGVDLIPSNLDLATLEVSLVNVMSREYTLKNAIENIKNRYDYILIDCMPSLGMITINALATADKVIIPVESQFLAARGMSHLLNTVLKVRKNINQDLQVGGIVLTMTDARTNLSKNIQEELRDTYGSVFKLFNTTIPNAVKVAEASREGVSILKYDRTSKGAIAYQTLAKEVISDEREKQNANRQYFQTR